MKICKLMCFFLLCAHFQSINSQNLLDTSTWVVGSSNVAGFYKYGSTTKNVREFGTNHVGENVVIWKAIPDASNYQDGGWTTNYIAIDNTKKYRLSVWIKKTNSNDGNTYFGCQQWQPDSSINNYTVLNLNNTVNTNPYFKSGGDLPKLDRWYLLVGFVHSKNSTSTINEGAIYDGVTGEIIQNITDLKFHANTNVLLHRAFLYADSNNFDRQYSYGPRMEVVNSSTPTINQLLSLNPSSELVFAYDNSGNQKQRFYCSDSNCIVPNPPTGKVSNEKNVVEEQNKILEEVNLSDQLKIFPNPTKDIVYFKIDSELFTKTESIKIYNSNSSLIEVLDVNNPKQSIEVDLTGKPSGVYFVHIHTNNGSKSITKKIIKN